jgi:hypothetical protein
VWYPGAEPGGGSYIAQRMLASKSEKDSLGAVLFFNVAHYVLRPWPWILVGLASLIVYPNLSDIQQAFPNLDPKLLGHDIAYPAMLKFLPVGFAGLMVGGLIAANSSTILTHLNWGASYLVHDFYRRFIKTDASEKHYVLAGRLATVGLFIFASSLTFVLDTAKDAFDIILQVGAGTGLLYLIRWFWWRINAWCEVVAMVSSFLTSIGILIVNKWQASVAKASMMESLQQAYASQPDVLQAKIMLANNELSRMPSYIATHQALILTVIVTTVCWLLTAYLAPQTDQKILVEFYKKIRPFGPGWKSIREQAGISAAEAAATHENIPLALLGWVAGSSMIWTSLFVVGNFLYGRTQMALALLGLFLVSGFILLRVISKLWSAK